MTVSWRAGDRTGAQYADNRGSRSIETRLPLLHRGAARQKETGSQCKVAVKGGEEVEE